MSEQIFIQVDGKVKEAKGETLAYLEAWQSEANQLLSAQLETEATQKANKLSAVAKLTALGLTESEVFALLGITEIEPTTNEI
jgi:hypothetical protein